MEVVFYRRKMVLMWLPGLAQILNWHRRLPAVIIKLQAVVAISMSF